MFTNASLGKTQASQHLTFFSTIFHIVCVRHMLFAQTEFILDNVNDMFLRSILHRFGSVSLEAEDQNSEL